MPNDPNVRRDERSAPKKANDPAPARNAWNNLTRQPQPEPYASPAEVTDWQPD
jgi:hypothetical protein